MKSKIRQINIYSIIVVLSISITNCKKETVNDPMSKQFNSDLSYGEVFDIEGNKYATISIGQQTWMAENLRTSLFANGDSIPNCEDLFQWINLTSAAWAYYQNSSENNPLHGKLYNWHVINDPRNICPNGWHVPSDEEWSTLLNFLGGSKVAGSKLKSRLIGAWESEYQGQAGVGLEPSNESGFSSLASGCRRTGGQFLLMTYRSAFWSTKEYNASEAFIREIFWNGDEVGRYSESKSDGNSCRCIKD